MALESYELNVTITRQKSGIFEWGIVQELIASDKTTEFQFLAGGQEDTIDEAANRVSEEIKTLF